MSLKATHDMFPDAAHDEAARQFFVRSFMVHVHHNITPGNDILYKTRVAPRIEQESGHPPKTRREVREGLAQEPYNQMWSCLMRTSQEMMYNTVRPSLERQMPDLKEKARQYTGKLGTLSVDPEFEIPPYHAKVDIHCKPGAYHTQVSADDFLAGAEYDRTIHLYFQGLTGPNNDDMGLSLATWVKTTYRDLEPKRILDMGCTVGHSTLPYVDVFPDAEVYAIDVAGPCLQYGHHRAEAFGKEIHFSQQNAEKTNYEDGSFDLIVSHILFHETSSVALRRILKECKRLLRPGGVVVHLDVLSGNDPYEKYICEWNAHYNNEPFMGTLQDENFAQLFEEAGFSPDNFFRTKIPSIHIPKALGIKATGTELGIGHYSVVGSKT